MKQKIFSVILTACLLLSPLAVLGATIEDPASDAASWILNETFGESFTSNMLSDVNHYKHNAKKVTVNGESCLRIWNNDTYQSTAPYPIDLKQLETPVSEGYVVYKASFLIPETLSDSDPLSGAVMEAGKPEFSILNSHVTGWDNDVTFAVRFDAANGKVGYYYQAPPVAGMTYGNYTGDVSVTRGISYDMWHDMMMVVDLTNDKASVYLDGTLVIDSLSIDTTDVATCFGVEPGTYSALKAVSYVDNIKIYTANEIDIIEGEEKKIYKRSSFDNEDILGYYAYDDFQSYKGNTSGILKENGNPPSDTSRYDMTEYIHRDTDGNQYLEANASWFQGRAFALYSPLKAGYAHMHVDLKLNEGAKAFVSLGKLESINSSANPRGDMANAVFFGENQISMVKMVMNSTFTQVLDSQYLPLTTDFSVGEWHSVDFLFDMDNKQFDLFIDGTPRIVDMYLAAAENDHINDYDNPITDFTYRSAVVGRADVSDGSYYVDNLYVADVTGKYVADMFEEGYKKLLEKETTKLGDTYYMPNDFQMPSNGYAMDDDIHVAYSTTNEGVMIYERVNYSPTDEMRVAIIGGAIDNKGEFTVDIFKGGEERTVTVPLSLVGELVPSDSNLAMHYSPFIVAGELKANEEIVAGGFVENVSETDEKLDLVLAVYEGKQLKSFEIESVTAKAGEVTPLKTASMTLPADVGEHCTAKVFVWNFAGLTPLN